MKWVSFGEMVWDVFPEEKHLGGAPLNFAAHAAQHGIEAHMLSAVGGDELGAEAIRLLQGFGVHTDSVAVLADRTTGVCDVTFPNGAISYNLHDNVAWDAIDTSAMPADADLLYFGTLSLRHEANRAQLLQALSQAAVPHIAVDVNIRAPYYSEEVLRFAFEHATIIKISDEELPVVQQMLSLPGEDAEATCRRVCERFANLRTVVLTCGSDGAIAYDRASDTVYCAAAVKVEAVSAVGAGDSFFASFLAYYLDGRSLSDSLAHAAKVAAFVVSRLEAVPPYSADLR